MKREVIVTADGRDRAVVVEGPLAEVEPTGGPGTQRPTGGIDGRFRVTIDGVPRDLDAHRIRPGTWSILLEGRSFVVDLDRRRAGISASVGATDIVLQVEDALHRRLAATAVPKGKPRGEIIRAPIAGKVVKVLVAVGDEVAARGPVLVLEAMKMENELVTERGGKVTAVHKQTGQAVDTGDVLVELA